MADGAGFAKLQQQIQAQAARLVTADDEHASVVALTELIAFLQEQLNEVTVRRDDLLAELIPKSASNRKLAAELGLSRQRIDQLAQITRRGRTPRA